MKATHYLILGIIILFTNISYAQIKGIDPRQFCSINELNRQSNETLRIYEDDSISVLKIDANSLISIAFNQDSMTNHLEYYGNVSIAAKINDESIKVSPYSKVGEKQGKIGVNSASPIEISSHLISLLEQMNSLEINLEAFWLDKFYNSEKLTNTSNNKDLEYCLAYFKMMPAGDTIKFTDLNLKVKSIIEFYTEYNASLLLFSTNELSFTIGDINTYLQVLISQNSEIQAEEHIKYVQNEIAVYKDLLLRLNLIKNYINYFQQGEQEIKNLYLRLLKQDELAIDDLTNKLEKSTRNLQLLDSLDVSTFDEMQPALDASLRIVTTSISTYNKKVNKSISALKLNLYVSDTVFVSDSVKEKLEIDLAKEVGKLIYQKLVVGSIDLREARAKDGDVLKISILWYQNDDPLSVPLELDLATFDIKDVGWKLKVADSFFLVNRLSEPDNDENTSPSMFKGAPGVSLLFTYGNNGYENNILKRLEPSIGINVSYLDFYTNKDLEVGIGAVLGLLKNRVFITYGYNLHAESDKTYLGLGFSFANIASQIKK